MNQALECTLRPEEIPVHWNTVQVQWGTGCLWQGLQHRPGRTAVLSVGPKVQLQGSSTIAGLSLPGGSQSPDSLWLDAAACTVEVLEGSLQFTVVALQDAARDVLTKSSPSMLKALGFCVESLGDALPPVRVALPADGATPVGAVYVGSGKEAEPQTWSVWSEGWDLALHPDRKAAARADREHHAARAGGENQLLELEGWKLVCACPLGRPCHADVLADLFKEHKRQGAQGQDLIAAIR